MLFGAISKSHSYRFSVQENTTAYLVSYLWSLKTVAVVCCHWYLARILCPQTLYRIQIWILFLCEQIVQIHYYRKIPVIGKVCRVHKVKWEYYRHFIPKEVCDQEYWRANGEVISRFSSMKNCHVDNMSHGTGHVSPFFFFFPFLCCWIAQSQICVLPLPSTRTLVLSFLFTSLMRGFI